MTREEFFNFIKKPKETPNKMGRSTKYYLDVYDKHHDKKWFLSWNWPAFFFGAFWFLYRRMYLYLLLLWGSYLFLAASSFTALGFFFKDSASIGPMGIEVMVFTTLLLWIIEGALGNAFYIRFTKIKSLLGHKKLPPSIIPLLSILILTIGIFILLALNNLNEKLGRAHAEGTTRLRGKEISQ